MKAILFSSIVTLLLFSGGESLQSVSSPFRRGVLAQSLGGIASCLLWDNLPEAAHADDAPLTEEEMAARVARKLELQKMAAQGQPAYVKASDVRSDVNPEAGADLRSRSFADNARISMAKQEELKKRDNSQKREDLCEMLGRGC